MIKNFIKFIKESNSNKKKYKYNAWKVDQKGNPIDGSDRTFRGESKRNVLQLLAHEEGIKHPRNLLVLRLSDGTSWHVSKIGN